MPTAGSTAPVAQTFFIDKVYDQVAVEMANLNTQTNGFVALFEQRTSQLASIELPTLPPLPTFADPSVATNPIPALPIRPTRPPVDLVGFNPVDVPPDILLSVAAEIDAIIAQIPTFTPSITTLAIPPVPTPIDTSGTPIRPAVNTSVTIPVAPDFSLPSVGQLTDIIIPDFVFPTLPDFTDVAPALTASAPAAVLPWVEPTYQSELFDEIHGKVSSMLAGQSGLPPAVEQALFDRARGREDVLALKSTQEAFEVFAGKGYSMPPGMLAKQVNAVIEDNQLKSSAIGRDIYIQVQQTLIQQLNTAVERGIAMEQLTANLFNNMLDRKLQIEKFRLEQAVAIYNAEIQAFNIRSQAYNVSAQVYKIKVDAALTKLEEFRARIEAAKAQSQLNQQIVQIYTAQLDAVKTKADTYRATLQAAQIQTEVAKSQIELYREDINAWATRIQADKTRFEAYKVQIEGETAKVGILESETRAFAARVQAIDTVGQLSVRRIQARIEAAGQATQRYVAQVGAERDRVVAHAEQFRTLATMYSSDIEAYATEYRNNVALRELDVKQIEAAVRNAIARYEAEIAKYSGESQRLIQLAELSRDSLKVLSQLSAQLAAGAMSARNLGMSVSGQGQGSDSFNINQNYNFS